MVPSDDDDALTARVAEAAKLLGLVLLEHVVIGGADFFSYADSGRLPK